MQRRNVVHEPELRTPAWKNSRCLITDHTCPATALRTPRGVAALASSCLVFHWVLVALFRSPLDRDLTEIEILPRAGRVGSAQAKR